MWIKTNLMQRIMTSIVLIIMMLAAIFLLPPMGFYFFTGIITMLAAGEWAKLSGIQKSKSYWLFMIDVFSVLILSLFVPVLWVMMAGIAAWILIPLRQFKWAGIIMLPVCFKALNYLCFLNPHPVKLIQLLLMVYLADTFAYFMGKQWGKHKLAPRISPKKTIEGALGAIILVSILAVLTTHSLKLGFLSIVVIVVSMMGDLFESFMKRCQNVKDSGTLLPGHGGILDRIDSLMTAAPVFVLGLLFF